MTVGMIFPDGAILDFPMEAIAEQLTTEEEPERKAPKIQQGRVRLCTIEEGFQEKFGRFPNDACNGISAEKEALAGKEGEVIKTYGDMTVTIQFDTPMCELDFPMEAIAEQLTEAFAAFKIGEKVTLKDLPEEEFKACFVRFEGDDLNYWNPSKQAKAGKEGKLKTVYGDNTVTMEFEDGESWDFPFEAIVNPNAN